MSYGFEAAAQTLLLNTAGDPSPLAVERALRACAKATAEECAKVAFMEQPMIPCGELDDAVCRACDNIAAAIRALAERVEGDS